jgi:hypothetical protein
MRHSKLDGVLNERERKQAGAELRQAQVKPGIAKTELCFHLIKIEVIFNL